MTWGQFGWFVSVGIIAVTIWYFKIYRPLMDGSKSATEKPGGYLPTNQRHVGFDQPSCR